MPLLLVGVLVLAQQTAPPRDAASSRPATAATAVIRGRVVAAATHQPLHRVRVTLNTNTPNPPTAVTDTRGVFEITDAPAGAYTLTAVRAGYLPVQYGQRRSGETGRRIDIKNGDVVEGIDLALVRGGVISGRILDETGDVYAGARVEAIDLRYVRGQRVSVPVDVTTSNDAGEYRLSGLAAGTYQVRASTTDVWEGDDGKSTFVHAITYFPGVTASSSERPTALTVGTGQEIAGTDLQLIPGRAATISGVLRDANGDAIAGQIVNLDRITRTTGGALLSAGFGAAAVKTDGSGAFQFSKLAAGEYNVYTGTSEVTAVATTVTDGETRAVAVTPRHAPAVSGTIASDEQKPLPFSPGRLTIDPVSTDPNLVFPQWSAARAPQVAADGTFRVLNLDGTYLFRVTGLPDEWMLSAVRLGERDVTDTPLTVSRGDLDIKNLQIVLTRTGATLEGVLVDQTGAAAPDATVIVFAEDAAKWGLASRFVKAVRPTAAAHFSVHGLPPGRYRVIARDVVADGQWDDPEFLQTLVKDALSIELNESGTATIKLTVEAGR